jgi:hypothetical protein
VISGSPESRILNPESRILALTGVHMVTVLYYALVAFVSCLLIVNLLKSKQWERDVLYVLVLVPFLLRLFRLK